MATYIIGDLHGCFEPLQRLLQQIEYDPQRDTLWFVGDIVNRGPQSLECLRFVHDTVEGGRGYMVLGNHDIHLLAQVAGFTRFRSPRDTLDAILTAPDRDRLIHWLRQQPLMLPLPDEQGVVVHAGLPPQWSVDRATERARAAEAALQADDWDRFIRETLYGNAPACEGAADDEGARLRYTFNALTRMRYCDAEGCLDFHDKGRPSPAQLAGEGRWLPWFVHPHRASRTHPLFFGHWSTLGAWDGHNVHALDTGCLWGGQLTAWHVEAGRRHTLQCPQTCRPGK